MILNNPFPLFEDLLGDSLLVNYTNPYVSRKITQSLRCTSCLTTSLKRTWGDFKSSKTNVSVSYFSSLAPPMSHHFWTNYTGYLSTRESFLKLSVTFSNHCMASALGSALSTSWTAFKSNQRRCETFIFHSHAWDPQIKKTRWWQSFFSSRCSIMEQAAQYHPDCQRHYLFQNPSENTSLSSVTGFFAFSCLHFSYVCFIFFDAALYLSAKAG